MEESGSSQPAKCPCGFWGSTKTLGLCSRCYKEQGDKSSMSLDTSPGMDATQHKVTKPELLRASTSGLRVVTKDNANNRPPTVTRISPAADARLFLNTATDPLTNDVTTPVAAQTTPLYQLPGNQLPGNQLPSTQLLGGTQIPSPQLLGSLPPLRLSGIGGANGINSVDCQPIPVNSYDTNNSADTNPSPTEGTSNGKRKSTDSPETCSAPKYLKVPPLVNKSSAGDEPTEKSTDEKGKSDNSGGTTSDDRSSQRNRKRCNKCAVKLNIAQRAIGTCKCEYIFCQLHRMPEQHDCDFNHKEDGRRDAKEKMVKPKRHVGTSCRRIDSEHS